MGINTEDDTFRILSRASIPEMLRNYEDWIANGHVTNFEGLEEMCSRHGWCWNEFSIEGARWRDHHLQNIEDKL